MRLVVRAADGNELSHSIQVTAEKATAGAGPWLLRSKLPLSEIQLQNAVIASAGPPPRWALLINATLPTPAAAIAATLASLRHHAYPHWAATILTTAAQAPGLEAAHPGTRIVTQGALAEIAGAADWLCLVAAGDTLGEDALLELSTAAALNPAASLLYPDERRIDPSDGELKAFFKPDWAPELLLATNYIGHGWAARPALARSAGLTVEDLAAFGQYDAVLRLTERASAALDATERTDAVHHVPKVLIERGTGGDPRPMDRPALRRALRRRSLRGEVRGTAVPGTYRIRRPAPPKPLVSIIIPTIASKGFIEVAINSIRKFTTSPAIEIVCIDNIPERGTPEQQRWKKWIEANADRTVRITSAFNWSRFNNRGARAASGDMLLFLNDDIEMLDPSWLQTLVEQAARPEIGVVGPQLLYPDGRVQHAGMVLARRAARHAFRFFPRDEPGPFGLALTQRDVMSVTGACMLVRREVFDAVGGFDERHAIVNNDLDFNLRVRRAGYNVIYTPHVSLIHHEMVSRAKLADTYNQPAFLAEWGDTFLKGDPFFSPHLSTDYDDFLPDAEPVKHFVAGHPVMDGSTVRRILALKLDHIGDFITAFPAFRRIKQKFPQAELVVLAAKASLSLAQLEPSIDRVIEFNFYHARSEKGRRTVSRKELLALQAALAPEQFDMAIDLRRQPDTRDVLRFTGARWLGGFDHGYQHPWLDFAVEFEGDIAQHFKRDHVVDSLIHLVDAIAANCEASRDVIHAARSTGAARHEIRALLERHGLPTHPAGPFICVHTGGGRRQQAMARPELRRVDRPAHCRRRHRGAHRRAGRGGVRRWRGQARPPRRLRPALQPGRQNRAARPAPRARRRRPLCRQR